MFPTRVNASENLIQDFTQRPLVDDDHEPANECMIVEMSQRSETSGHEKLVMDSSQTLNYSQDATFSETQTIVASIDNVVGGASQD